MEISFWAEMIGEKYKWIRKMKNMAITVNDAFIEFMKEKVEIAGLLIIQVFINENIVYPGANF